MLNGRPLKLDAKLNFVVTLPAQLPVRQTAKPIVVGTVMRPRSRFGLITRFRLGRLGMRSTHPVANSLLVPETALNRPPSDPEPRNLARSVGGSTTGDPFTIRGTLTIWASSTAKLFKIPPFGNVPDPLKENEFVAGWIEPLSTTSVPATLSAPDASTVNSGVKRFFTVSCMPRLNPRSDTSPDPVAPHSRIEQFPKISIRAAPPILRPTRYKPQTVLNGPR